MEEVQKSELSKSLYARYISERAHGQIIENDSGFIVYRSDSADCYVIEIYVRPECRRSGKGRELFNELESRAISAGCKKITGGIYLEDSQYKSILAAVLHGGFSIKSANGGIIYVEKELKQESKPIVYGDGRVSLIGYENHHYEMIKSWFDKRNFPAPDPHLLPQIGVIAVCNNNPIACGFLFRTDGGIAMLGNLGSDKDASSEHRNIALDAVINSLSEIAANQGFMVVSCATNLPGLMTRFERIGFEKTDESVSHFRRKLCQ